MGWQTRRLRRTAIHRPIPVPGTRSPTTQPRHPDGGCERPDDDERRAAATAALGGAALLLPSGFRSNQPRSLQLVGERLGTLLGDRNPRLFRGLQVRRLSCFDSRQFGFGYANGIEAFNSFSGSAPGAWTCQRSARGAASRSQDPSVSGTRLPNARSTTARPHRLWRDSQLRLPLRDSEAAELPPPTDHRASGCGLHRRTR